jgi:hypothetical protein
VTTPAGLPIATLSALLWRCVTHEPCMQSSDYKTIYH